MSEDLVGDIAGRYRIVRRLGHGGMGSVYEVDDESSGRRRALKTLLPEFGKKPEMLERFRAEVEALKRVQSDFVVEIFDWGFDPQQGFPFLVMELLEGESLDDVVRKRAPLAPSTALNLLAQIAAALDAIHERDIVHRDLKPSNVFLQRRRGMAEVKLLDFGIAKFLDTGSSTTAVMGTEGYMAPEQRVGQGVDHRTDVYALGKLAHDLLFGLAPPEGFDHTAAFRQDSSGAVEAWFARATQWDKRKRFDCASEAIGALASALKLALPLAPRIEWDELHSRTVRAVVADSLPVARQRPRWTRLVGAGAMALVAVGSLAAFWALGQDPLAGAQSRTAEPTTSPDTTGNPLLAAPPHVVETSSQLTPPTAHVRVRSDLPESLDAGSSRGADKPQENPIARTASNQRPPKPPTPAPKPRASASAKARVERRASSLTGAPVQVASGKIPSDQAVASGNAVEPAKAVAPAKTVAPAKKASDEW